VIVNLRLFVFHSIDKQIFLFQLPTFHGASLLQRCATPGAAGYRDWPAGQISSLQTDEESGPFACFPAQPG
ncbi:MAG: hypothetical protein WCD80_12030, partial [Desulfobaccales bacterium]